MLRNPSILLTDDDSGFRETLRELLEPRGFRTFEAADGEEALSIIVREPLHLVLLDFHMPKLTGLETLRRLRQLNFSLPCILMSAQMDERMRKEAEAAQAFSVLHKPATRQEITRTVDSALRATYGWG